MPVIENTAANLAIAIERAKSEILEDVGAGVVPTSVRSFSELHDYVDANGYGGAFEYDFGGDGAEEAVQADCDFWNAVQNAVDDWIKSGAVRDARVNCEAQS